MRRDNRLAAVAQSSRQRHIKRRHAGRRRNGYVRALQRRDLLFEGGACRVPITRIALTRDLAVNYMAFAVKTPA